MLDRIDLQVEVDNITYDELTSSATEEGSAAVKERVDRARAVQRERFAGQSIVVNSEMGEREMNAYCALSAEGDNILRGAFEKMHLSARARSRIIKVARTIADLDGSQYILPKHVFEAVSYRIYDKMS